MNNREPQVWDVYYDKVMDNLIAIKTDYETYYYGLCVDYIYVGNPSYWDILICESKQIGMAYALWTHPASFTLSLGAIKMMEYKGKLAPRYKRLLWIYFVPDKEND